MHSQPFRAVGTFDTALLFVIGEIDASEQTERTYLSVPRIGPKSTEACRGTQDGRAEGEQPVSRLVSLVVRCPIVKIHGHRRKERLVYKRITRSIVRRKDT